MVTQTPSSYEGEGEGLNFTREMIGIFNGEVELKFWTSNVIIVAQYFQVKM